MYYIITTSLDDPITLLVQAIIVGGFFLFAILYIIGKILGKPVERLNKKQQEEKERKARIREQMRIVEEIEREIKNRPKEQEGCTDSGGVVKKESS